VGQATSQEVAVCDQIFLEFYSIFIKFVIF
jgi:hypothetical protein